MGVRATLDSNILVYAELEPESPKGQRARQLISAAAAEGVLTVQALLDFIAVIRRKRPESLDSAVAKAEIWSRVFDVAATSPVSALAAITLSREHGLQVWDAVIWCAASEAGAVLFLSEDLQDGRTIDHTRAVNPFTLSDEAFERLISDGRRP